MVAKDSKRKRNGYLLVVHGNAAVVAARKTGTLSLDQAALLVAAGARKLRVPLPVPATREDTKWREAVHAVGVAYLTAASIAAGDLGTPN